MSELQVLPTLTHMLRGQQHLSPDLRNSAVYVPFTKPVPIAKLDEFMRVHLTEELLRLGEERFYRVELVQPHHSHGAKCANCRRLMQREGPGVWRCIKFGCTFPDGTPSHCRTVMQGPKRGVVKIVRFADHEVCGPNGTVEYTACVLHLDRRYDDKVIAAVLRTVCELGDEIDAPLAL
jgi:ribosomal protein L37AE/L43A